MGEVLVPERREEEVLFGPGSAQGWDILEGVQGSFTRVQGGFKGNGPKEGLELCKSSGLASSSSLASRWKLRGGFFTVRAFAGAGTRSWFLGLLLFRRNPRRTRQLLRITYLALAHDSNDRT